MLTTWEITYQIGTSPARIAKCMTDFDTPATDQNFQKMISISRNVKPEQVRLVKILEAA